MDTTFGFTVGSRSETLQERLHRSLVVVLSEPWAPVRSVGFRAVGVLPRPVGSGLKPCERTISPRASVVADGCGSPPRIHHHWRAPQWPRRLFTTSSER